MLAPRKVIFSCLLMIAGLFISGKLQAQTVFSVDYKSAAVKGTTIL